MYFFLFCALLGIELRVSCMLIKHSTAEPHPSPCFSLHHDDCQRIFFQSSTALIILLWGGLPQILPDLDSGSRFSCFLCFHIFWSPSVISDIIRCSRLILYPLFTQPWNLCFSEEAWSLALGVLITTGVCCFSSDQLIENHPFKKELFSPKVVF